ncbi:hypothetical protein [Pantoea ananatis]|uniref:hypothetical protein n=1 Tax=Pantoea ananas TaxID=553 RepID=UPI0003B1DA40|nr:hypothetical protein [Pantoea ananatis]ERM12564.1 hypothetical protein L585_20120 [Pantoea ananatis BRT175]
MDFKLASMVVDQISLTVNSEELGPKNNLKIVGALEYNESDKRSARMITAVNLTAPNKYNIDAKFVFLFEFEKEVTGDEAEKAITDAKSEAQVFPYIQAYLTNFIVSSGYPHPSIPLALF